ncbi:hypothetical protein [Dankookia sp. P2]|uniref:hypothetical protein n=1 Tax=Dankookia sp. P2 TaxID=3423955 RepID=UPI003D66B32C
MPPILANARDSIPGLAGLSERLLGFAAGRSLPRFRRDAFHDAELPAPDGREGEVILFADVFNRYFEPENLRAAARVLAAAGYRVAVARPAKGARPLDEGRTLLAAGLVEEARAEARRTLEALPGFASPVIGIEPSSLLTLRDEFPALLPGQAARGAGRARPAAVGIPGAGEAPHGAEAHRRGRRAYPRPLPPEELRRLPRRGRHADPGAGPEGDADHLLLLRHGRVLRL